MSSTPYTPRGVCSIQINSLSCTGAPLTVADGDTNVIVLAGAGDATEVEWGKVYQTIAAQNDGPCWSAPPSKYKTGDSMVFRHCSREYLDLRLTIGDDEPVYNQAGEICGFASPQNGVDDCNYCPGTCDDGESFSVITWSAKYDCDNEPLRNAGGEPLYEITVATKVINATEQSNRRRSVTPSSNRVDWGFDLVSNAGYGFGPGDIFATEAFYNADLATAKNSAVITFESAIAPPATVDCPCNTSGDGQFITAAAIGAGTAPTPIGD